MTYEEAKSILNTFIEINGRIELPIVIQGVKKGIEALEKQISKKPTHEATLYRSLTCPNCKNVIEEYIKFNGEKVRVLTNFCKYCGQKILWEEYE